MVEMNIKFDVGSLTKKLDRISQKHLPFAAASAFTKTLKKDVLPAVKREANASMEIKRSWVLKGFRIIPAKKKDFPFFRAGIGTRDSIVAKLVKGEDVIGSTDKGIFKQGLAVPSSFAKRKYGDKLTNKSMWLSRIVPKSYNPRKTKTKAALKRKKKFFPVKSKRSTKYTHMVLERTGPTKNDVEVIYYVYPKIKLTRQFEMDKVAVNSFKRRISDRFRVAMRNAIRSGR